MILYKYVSIDILMKILQSNSIRFTQISELNDPFEMNPIFKFSATTLIDYTNKNEFKEIDESYYNTLVSLGFEEKKIVELIQEEKNSRNSSNPYIEQNPINGLENYNCDFNYYFLKYVDNNLGVLSLASNPLEIAMWAHYADNHYGAVLGFNVDNVFFNDESNFCWLRKVVYKDERPEVCNYTGELIDYEFIFTKSKSWDRECEWRLIKYLYISDKINGKINLFNFPVESLKIIIFGINTDQISITNTIDLVRNFKEFDRVRFYKVYLHDKSFKIKLKYIRC